MTIRSVAVIGLGAMGAPMAQRVQAAGYELTVCERNPAALAPFVQGGAHIAATPADCAGADLVIVLVATPEQVQDVVLGAQGVCAGLGGSKSPILAIMSTVPADSVKRLGEVLRPRSVRVIDAPVSGGYSRAQEGTLTTMIGGDPDDVKAVDAVFSCFANNRFHCGALGAGETMKIINNMLGLANVVLAGEAYKLALNQGLDLADVARVVDVSSGRNAFSADPAGPQAKYATMTRDHEAFDSLMAIIRKDLHLAVETAAATGENYPALRSIEAVVAKLGEETFEDWLRIAKAPSTPQ
jgi:3-hydroxyisobutyrate dehydrogenase-like beta-hydroxyacid dehydrogenase